MTERRTPHFAAVFDLDGTLVDAFEDITDAANHIRNLVGLTPITVKEVLPHVGRGAQELVRGVSQATSQEELDRLYGELVKFYEAHPGRKAKLYPGVQQSLSALRESGAALGVCTNKPHSVTLALLDKLGATPWFDSIVGETPSIARKPAPDMLNSVMRAVGATPENTAMVGDTTVDVATGLAAKVGLVVGVTHGQDDRPTLLAAGAQVVVDSFAEVTEVLLDWTRKRR